MLQRVAGCKPHASSSTNSRQRTKAQTLRTRLLRMAIFALRPRHRASVSCRGSKELCRLHPPPMCTSDHTYSHIPSCCSCRSLVVLAALRVRVRCLSLSPLLLSGQGQGLSQARRGYARPSAPRHSRHLQVLLRGACARCSCRAPRFVLIASTPKRQLSCLPATPVTPPRPATPGSPPRPLHRHTLVLRTSASDLTSRERRRTLAPVRTPQNDQDCMRFIQDLLEAGFQPPDTLGQGAAGNAFSRPMSHYVPRAYGNDPNGQGARSIISHGAPPPTQHSHLQQAGLVQAMHEPNGKPGGVAIRGGWPVSNGYHVKPNAPPPRNRPF